MTNTNILDLRVYKLKSDKDIVQYNIHLDSLSFNPFYKIELIKPWVQNQKIEKLYYFVMSKENKILILMPFIIREINAIISSEKSKLMDVCSPYGYSGPIFKKNIPDTYIKIFWKKVDKWYLKNNIISEFIRFNLEENWKGYNGNLLASLKNVNGKIIAEEKQWENFKPKVRNNYRKALKNNLTSTIYHQNIPDKAIKDFHNIYLKTMKRNDAIETYFYTLEYFKKFISNHPSLCAIIIVCLNDKPISTELILLSEKTIYSFLGGTDANYFNKRPNDFLKIEVLNWGRKNGYQNYVLGGGRIDNDKLYQYKKTFFHKDEDLIYYTGRKIINKKAYQKLVELKHNIDYKINDDDLNNEYFPKYRK